MLSRRFKRVILPLLAVALGTAIWLSYSGLRSLRQHLVAALDVTFRLEAMASSLAAGGPDPIRLSDRWSLQLLRDDLDVLEENLRALERELAIPMSLCPYLGWVPWIGPDIVAAPDLLSLAINSASAGWWALLGAEPILMPLIASSDVGTEPLLGEALANMQASTAYFREAEEATSRALVARTRIQSSDLMPRIAGFLDRLDPYLSLAQMGIRAALIAPELLGSNGSRTYLLLAQNSQELRPTGGLISGVGTLSVHMGQITQVTLLDSYMFDDYGSNAHPPAPAPLAKYMWAGVLTMRDANWSPHFPASAQVITSLYQLSQKNTRIDGVIAADLEAVELFLRALGPVQPAGYDQPISEANVIALLQQYWSAPVDAGTIQEQTSSDWWSHRKDIMEDLLQAMLQKAQMGTRDLDLRALVFAAMDALEGRHLMLYGRDADMARDLGAFGWDGAIRAIDGDYLMVIDANLGFNKLDANIERAIDYQLYPDTGRLAARATVTYTNLSPSSDSPCRHEDLFGLTEYQAESYQDLTEGCYWDYVRLYVPAGSELIDVAGLIDTVDISREESKSVFGTFFVVPPGQTHELRFTYYLPDRIAEELAAGSYDLLVQKQPGTGAIPLRVAASLPSGETTNRRVRRQSWISPTGWDYETFLDADLRIQIGLQKTDMAWSMTALALLGLALIGAGVALRRHQRALGQG